MKVPRMCHISTWWITLISYTLSVMVANSPVLTKDCEVGVRCSQCPTGHYTQASNGSLLCCPGCSGAVLYHGDLPNTWCVCYADSANHNLKVPRIIKFPASSRLLVGGAQHPGSNPSLEDAFFILNHGHGGLGNQKNDNGHGGVSPVVQHALTLMADTIERLHARVTRLERIISHTQDLKHSGSINRVSTASTPSPPIEKLCPTNYSKIGNNCYYVSVWHDYRAIWKDARAACEGLGGKLAEPLTRMTFLGLTRQLTAVPSASGFSYWLGGLYPGVSWLWSYAGENVTLNPAYWAEVDSAGKRVTPGDISSGRCLSLAYSLKSSKYYYFPDECGFEKYFICQLIDGKQQRMFEH